VALHSGANRFSKRPNGHLTSLDVLEILRGVLRDNGNMSPATVMLVLERVLAAETLDQVGCAMAFGLGLTPATMILQTSRDWR
jgi:predicted naringenin-chalcone synthase